MTRTPTLSLALAVTVSVLGGCGGGERSTLPTGPSPVSTTLAFSIASTSAGASKAPQCADQIRLHPSWWGFAQVSLVPVEPDGWGILFEDVPIGHHTVRLSAPPGCGEFDVGANGTRLTDRETAGSRTLFRFLLHADGSVSP